VFFIIGFTLNVEKSYAGITTTGTNVSDFTITACDNVTAEAPWYQWGYEAPAYPGTYYVSTGSALPFLPNNYVGLPTGHDYYLVCGDEAGVPLDSMYFTVEGNGDITNNIFLSVTPLEFFDTQGDQNIDITIQPTDMSVYWFLFDTSGNMTYGDYTNYSGNRSGIGIDVVGDFHIVFVNGNDQDDCNNTYAECIAGTGYLGTDFTVSVLSDTVATTTGENSIEWFTSPDWTHEESQATSTTNPTFTVNYFANYDPYSPDSEICLYIQTTATSTNTETLITKCETVINYNSTQTFSTTTALQNNTLYSYYATLGYSNQFSFKQTLTNYLQIGTVVGSGITPILWIQQPVDDTNATSTTSKSYGSILNLYSVITNKFPFNWAFALGEEIIQLVQMSTSTPSFTPATLDMASIPLTTWRKFPSATSTQNYSYTLFSTTTLHQVAQMGWVTLMRTLVSAILWVSFAGVVINRTLGIFSSQANT